MFTSNISLVTLVRGVGGKLSRLVYLAPRLGFGSNSVISSFLLHHNLGLFSCKRCEHYFSQTEMFTSNISLVTLVLGVGGKLSRLVYLAPHLGFGSGSVISQFLLHHYLGIFSCKRYKHYFSQTEMFTSNIQFGYSCPRGGGQAVQAGLSCPPQRIWVEQCHQFILIALRLGFGSGSVISQFLLHHNLGIFSCKRYKHYLSQTEMFTSSIGLVNLVLGWGASCPVWFIKPPTEDLGRTVSSVHSYCTIILEYLVVPDVYIISAKLKCLHPTSVWLPLSEGWGASCPGWFILPPA